MRQLRRSLRRTADADRQAAQEFVTAPVAAHMIGRAAYHSGTGALDQLVVDDLRDVR